MHEKLRNKGKSRKNYKSRGGVKVRSSLHSKGLLNLFQIVQWDHLMLNEVLLK